MMNSRLLGSVGTVGTGFGSQELQELLPVPGTTEVPFFSQARHTPLIFIIFRKMLRTFRTDASCFNNTCGVALLQKTRERP